MSTFPTIDRRRLLTGVMGAVAAAPFVNMADVLASEPLVPPGTKMTLEAFADTIVPGEKRGALDGAIAGAAKGPGAVQAGAIEMMAFHTFGILALLPGASALLNAQAVVYANLNLIITQPLLPAFAGLSYEHRAKLVKKLTTPPNPDLLIWVGFATLSAWAFDQAAYLDTAAAVKAKHPGLTWIRFPEPGPDGLWRFDKPTYGKALAKLHPQTVGKGSPA